MATAKFCSECGERLKLKHSGSLLSGSLCSRCSPRFNRGPLTLVVVVALSAAIGFTIGHYTTAREPFYYIGTPVESNSSRTTPAADDAATHSSREGEAVTQHEHQVLSPRGAEAICGARTKSGKPCQRKVKGGGYCWQHRDKVDENKSRPPK